MQKAEGRVETTHQSAIRPGPPGALAGAGNPQSEILKAIQQILARYQRQRAIRTGLVEALGLGCLLLFIMRLHALGLRLGWLAGIGLTGLLVLALWLWWVVRQERRRHPSTMLKLDQKLGLNGRLLTAMEFAHNPNPPLLYPILVQDTVQALPDSLRHVSRAVDRRTLVLAAVLLLFLLWPWQRMVPRQLASRTPFASPPPLEPPQVPPALPTQQSQASHDHQHASQDGQQSLGSGGQQRTAGAGGSSNSSPQAPGASNTSGQNDASSSGQMGQTQTGSQAGTQGGSQGSHADGQAPQPSQGGASASAEHQTPSQSTNPLNEQQRNASPQQHADSSSDRTKPSGQSQTDQGTSRQASGSGAEPQRARGSSQQTDATSTRSAKRSSERSGQEATPNHAAQKPGSRQAHASQEDQQGSNNLSQLAQGQGAQPLSAAQQEHLKAEIQQLLKDMSGELKQLQAQLETKQQDQPHPLPGTTTDPNLYDHTSTLEQRRGSQLPVLFDVDQQPTSAARQGGGVGESSGQVVGAVPRQQAEDVTLADQAAEEQGVTRQAIPPEYKPVFERLSHAKEPTSQSPSR